MGSNSSGKVYYALIIGGGVAGLAASLTLARQQHTAVVLDSGVYRNAPSSHLYNVLTWNQSEPSESRAAAKKNTLDYYTTIEFEKAHVVSVQETTGNLSSKQSFTASTSDGKQWHGGKVILANGVRDVFPDIEGYGDCWAKGIYHCFFCKGYEARGVESAGALAIPDIGTVPAALHAARTAARFTKSTTIYTHASNELKTRLGEARGD